MVGGSSLETNNNWCRPECGMVKRVKWRRHRLPVRCTNPVQEQMMFNFVVKEQEPLGEKYHNYNYKYNGDDVQENERGLFPLEQAPSSETPSTTNKPPKCPIYKKYTPISLEQEDHPSLNKEGFGKFRWIAGPQCTIADKKWKWMVHETPYIKKKRKAYTELSPQPNQFSDTHINLPMQSSISRYSSGIINGNLNALLYENPHKLSNFHSKERAVPSGYWSYPASCHGGVISQPMAMGLFSSSMTLLDPCELYCRMSIVRHRIARPLDFPPTSEQLINQWNGLSQEEREKFKKEKECHSALKFQAASQSLTVPQDVVVQPQPSPPPIKTSTANPPSSQIPPHPELNHPVESSSNTCGLFLLVQAALGPTEQKNDSCNKIGEGEGEGEGR